MGKQPDPARQALCQTCIRFHPTDQACPERPEPANVPAPTPRPGLHMYDHLPPVEAVVRAWNQPGTNPEWHEAMRRQTRYNMPILARALDRLTNEGNQP